MLQPFPAHLPIPPPQSLRLAITQLQHDRCIAQLQRPTAHSPHDFHPLQLTTAHGCPLQQDLPWLEVLVYGDISNESARGHYQRVSTVKNVQSNRSGPATRGSDQMLSQNAFADLA